MSEHDTQGRWATIKAQVAEKAGDAFVSTVRTVANEKTAAAAAERARDKYRGLPPDAVAGRLVKTARRKTKWEGAANGLAVTGAEMAIGSPAAPAAIGAAVTLVLGDLAWTTKVQTQLAMEIAHLYGVPYDKHDDDDVYLIFKLAMGLKGTERTAAVGGLVATEAARKQFRRVMRSGGARRELQKRVIKIAGPKVGRLLGEKSLLRLIPAANSALGYYFNNKVTKEVGRWATIKARVRSGSRKQTSRLLDEGGEAPVWALPVVYWVGTAGEGDPSDNFYAHYDHTRRRLELNDETMDRVEALCDDDQLDRQFADTLPDLAEEARLSLYDLAVLTAAMDLEVNDEQEAAVAEVAGWLGIDHDPRAVKRQIKRLKP